MQGAATSFYGFVIFDSLVITGGEVRNPRRNMPLALWSTLIIIFLCYFAVSTVLTLMVPYYLQDLTAPISHAFRDVYWTSATWILTIGGIVGLMSSLFGALFPLTRNLQNMIEDGFIFSWIGKIHPKYGTPVQGSILLTLISALIAGLFDLEQLLKLLSIGTLLAYTMVSTALIILRYTSNIPDSADLNCNNNRNNYFTEKSKQMDYFAKYHNGDGNEYLSKTFDSSVNNQLQLKRYQQSDFLNGKHFLLWERGIIKNWKFSVDQLINRNRLKTPNSISTRIVGILTTAYGKCL